MKIQEYIDYLKNMGATFINLESDVIATLPDIKIMVTLCQLNENDDVIYGNDYSAFISDEEKSEALITDIRIDKEFICLADRCGFIHIMDLEY